MHMAEMTWPCEESKRAIEIATVAEREGYVLDSSNQSQGYNCRDLALARIMQGEVDQPDAMMKLKVKYSRPVSPVCLCLL